MEGWFTSVCQALAPGLDSALSIVCAALALLILIAIGLGFGPLRAWLGLSSTGRPAMGHLPLDGDGLRKTWRLYRELRRTALRSR